MAHFYVRCKVHYIFSTKERRRQIDAEWRDRLWAYIGGIARENDMTALAVGGAEDHAHALILLPSTLTVAKGVQVIKSGSSKWVHETFPASSSFEWQEGYGAFSVGVSHVQDTIGYIARQVEHHRSRTFQDEFLAILRKHGIEPDEYTWG